MTILNIRSKKGKNITITQQCHNSAISERNSAALKTDFLDLALERS